MSESWRRRLAGVFRGAPRRPVLDRDPDGEKPDQEAPGTHMEG